MTDSIRIGFIGCGGVSHGHARHLSGLPGVQVVALSDTNSGSVERLKGAVEAVRPAAVFADWRQMLDQVELDAVGIFTPHTLHFEQAMASLERGLHVLVEKPMVSTVEHARALIARQEETGRVLLVAYQRHYQGPFLMAREWVATGRMGEVQFVSAFLGQDWLNHQRGTWRLDPALSGGGQLNDSGSHVVDAVLWVSGLRPVEVYAEIEHFDAPVDINSAVTVRFANGTIGNISVLGNFPAWWEDFTIGGSKAALLFRQGRLFAAKFGHGQPREVTDLPAGSNPAVNFVDAIRGLDRVRSTAHDALQVITLTEAAWASAARREPVRLP